MSEDQPLQPSSPKEGNQSANKPSPLEKRFVTQRVDSASTTSRWNAGNGDHEVLVDSQSPLIVINDSNLLTPSNFYSIVPIARRSAQFSAGEGARSSIRHLSKISQSQEQSCDSDHEDDRSDSSPALKDEGDILSKKSRYSVLTPSRVGGSDETDSIDIFQSKQAKKDEKVENELQKRLQNMLESTNYSILIAIFTIYTLFGDNIRVIFFGESSDTGFSVGSLIALAAFTIEILITLFAKKEYRWSFFFWLDIISTVSIIFDVHFIAAGIFPAS